MKLGSKIALGFTALVGIAVLLGGMSVWKMKSVAGESVKLAEEYVPEVKVAVDLRGAANRTMYAMRGYGLSEEKEYYTQALEEMAAVKTHLDEAAELAVKAVNLKALQGQVTEAKGAVDVYAGLMEQTEKAIAGLAAERAQLDQNAAAYMKNCADFLDGQNKNFRTDLDERQRKVELVTNIVNLGTQVRVTNFKAQGTKDMTLMREAVNVLAGLQKLTGELRPITRNAVNIKQIDDTEAAAQKYAENMAAYIKTSEAMVAAGEKMNANAAAYMKNCNDFLASQNEAMREEFQKDGANLEERLQKITLVNDIIDAGNAVRVDNFRGQAQQDPRLMREAMDKFKNVKGITAELRQITRNEADIARIDKTESAADTYLAAMEDYLENFLKLDGHRGEMDASAGQYVAECSAFLESQQKALAKDMHERHEKITLVNDIIDLGNDSRLKAFKSQVLRSPAIMEEAMANFPKLEEKYAALRKITRLDADLKRIDNTKAAGEQYAAGLSSFLAQWKGLQALGEQRGTAGNALIAACGTTTDAGIENMDKIANEAAGALSSSITIMIVGLAGAILIGALLAFFITRGITKPLNRIIAGLNEGADQVNDAAGQVSSASQQLAEGAGEQASSLEETSSALEEMSAMTRANAQNAKQANELASAAKTNADQGDQTMHQLNAAMGAINESSGQISKIIKVIEEIAFQTNLLALNAAVEAARAGEHGKGFAVVAEEVRNLAQRSAQAARDTTNLIEGSVTRAKEGTTVADSAGKALQAIVSDVTKVADLLNGITRASEEQAQGVDQVNTAVSEMDKVTQQNAAGAEESASAAEELSAQAATLKGVVEELGAMVSGAQAKTAAASNYKTAPAKRKPQIKAHAPHIALKTGAAKGEKVSDEFEALNEF